MVLFNAAAKLETLSPSYSVIQHYAKLIKLCNSCVCEFYLFSAYRKLGRLFRIPSMNWWTTWTSRGQLMKGNCSESNNRLTLDGSRVSLPSVQKMSGLFDTGESLTSFLKTNNCPTILITIVNLHVFIGNFSVMNSKTVKCL